jgi:hypothetical protein
MKKIVIAFFGLTLMFSACKKDPVDPDAGKTTLELLTNSTSKSWKLKSGTAKQNGLEGDLITSQSPCITDNVIVLFSDFGYEFKEGASKCDPNNPDLILKAKWSLTADNKTITIDKFIFLNYTIDKPSFVLSEVTSSTFSGTTQITLNNQTFELVVVFEEVK